MTFVRSCSSSSPRFAQRSRGVRRPFTHRRSCQQQRQPTSGSSWRPSAARWAKPPGRCSRSAGRTALATCTRSADSWRPCSARSQQWPGGSCIPSQRTRSPADRRPHGPQSSRSSGPRLAASARSLHGPCALAAARLGAREVVMLGALHRRPRLRPSARTSPRCTAGLRRSGPRWRAWCRTRATRRTRLPRRSARSSGRCCANCRTCVLGPQPWLQQPRAAGLGRRPCCHARPASARGRSCWGRRPRPGHCRPGRRSLGGPRCSGPWRRPPGAPAGAASPRASWTCPSARPTGPLARRGHTSPEPRRCMGRSLCSACKHRPCCSARTSPQTWLPSPVGVACLAAPTLQGIRPSRCPLSPGANLLSHWRPPRLWPRLRSARTPEASGASAVPPRQPRASGHRSPAAQPASRGETQAARPKSPWTARPRLRC
mmetsp:Transcript_12127/g.37958  ORF Transcript_12127/g.37958 Transcript_12127/m.37958 type:complete len:430 (-) Transcript_12127:137-1426(-)